MVQLPVKGDAFEAGCEFGNELLAYWRTLPKRGELKLPNRADLDPAAIKSLLPYIFLLKWHDHSKAVVRLRGTWLDERLARPKENYNLFDQYSVSHRASYENLLDALVHHPCGAAMQRQRVNDYGRAFIYHTSYLPMLDSEGFPRFLIGIGWLEKTDTKPAGEPSPVLYEGAEFRGLDYIDCGHGVPAEEFF